MNHVHKKCRKTILNVVLIKWDNFINTFANELAALQQYL